MIGSCLRGEAEPARETELFFTYEVRFCHFSGIFASFIRASLAIFCLLVVAFLGNLKCDKCEENQIRAAGGTAGIKE